MASRVISTRLAIEGESKYRQSVSAVNASLKTLRSELALVKSAHLEDANSMAALSQRGDVLARTMEAQREKVEAVRAALENAQRAQARYDAEVLECQTLIRQTEQAMSGLSGETEAEARERARLSQELETYKARLAEAQSYQAAAGKGVENWRQKLNASKTALNKLDLEVKKNSQYLEEAEKSADGCATSIDQYGKKTKEVEQNTKSTAEAVQALSAALAAAGVTAGIREIAQAIWDCIQASTEFESALAGVFKTIDGTPEQMAAIRDSIQQLSTQMPSTKKEIAGVAEAAGQLGIAVDDVMDFTHVMIDLGNATDLAAEEGAKSFARIANITQMAAEDYRRLGSVVVDLGNHSATTESEIVSMGTRIAASGTMSQFSVPAIMAYATALSSVGVEAEAGGSGISKLIKRFETMVATGAEELKGFAGVAGMTAEQFAQAWREDAAGALAAFVQGLGKVQSSGGSAVATMDKLGITEVRMSDAILRLAGAGDLLVESLDRADTAWAENTALTEEASRRYETTESKMIMLQNAMDNVMVAVGDALTPALREIAAAGTGAFGWAADFIERNPWLVQAITGVAAALVVLLGGITALMVVQKLIPLLKLFNATLLANPAVAVAAAITGLVVAIGTMMAATEQAAGSAEALKGRIRESREEYEKTNKAIAEHRDETLDMVESLEALAAKENKTEAEKAALLDLVGKLNEAVPDLTLKYDAQTDSLNLTAEAIRNMALAAAGEEERANAVKTLSDAYVKQEELTRKLEEAHARLDAAKRNAAQYDGLVLKAGMEGTAIGKAKMEVVSAQAAVDVLTEAEKVNASVIEEWGGKIEGMTDRLEGAGDATGNWSVALTALNTVLENIQGSYELLVKAQGEVEETGSLSISTLNTLTEKYPELTGYLVETADGYVLTQGALEDYMAAQEAEFDFALNGAKRASVVLINQNSDEKTSIQETTAAIRAKLAALQEEAKAKVSTLNQRYNHRSTLTEAESQEYREATAAVKNYGEALTNLDNASKNVEVFDRAGSMLGRDKAKVGKSGGKDKEKTQAELDLEAYKANLEELDHQRDMDLISEEDYYRRMGELSGRYLQDEANKKERWAAAEAIYGYRSAAYDREAAELDHQRNMGLLQEAEYYEGLRGLMDQYLTQGTDAWKKAKEKLYAWDSGAYDRELDALDAALEGQKITLEEHMAGLAGLREKYFAQGSDQWEEVAALMAQDQAAIFERERSDLDYLRDMGIIDDQKYYAELLELQREYLEEGSEEWRAVSVELYGYLEKCRQERQKAAETAHKEELKALEEAQKDELDTAKKGYDADAKALKEHLDEKKEALKQSYQDAKEAAKAEYEDRKAAIERELKLEQRRLNGVLAAIDAEVAARRNLREDQDQEDEIEAARKRLAAAQAQRAYARTDGERLEWDREIGRLTQALEEAVREKEDTAFYREKEAQKEEVQAQLQQVKDQADQDKEAAKAGYDDTLKQLEDWYEAAVAGAQADYDRRAEELEADYDRHVDKLEREYQADVERLKGELDAYIAKLEAGKEVRRVSNLDTVAPEAGAAAAGVDLGAILGLFHAAQAGVSNAYSASYGAVDNRKSASLSVNNYSTPLTEGQLMNLLRKVLEQMGR